MGGGIPPLETKISGVGIAASQSPKLSPGPPGPRQRIKIYPGNIFKINFEIFHTHP